MTAAEGTGRALRLATRGSALALAQSRLVVDGPEREREREGDVLVFDPTRVVDGIELSDDQILRFRPRAYSASVTRRTGAPAPSAA